MVEVGRGGAGGSVDDDPEDGREGAGRTDGASLSGLAGDRASHVLQVGCRKRIGIGTGISTNAAEMAAAEKEKIVEKTAESVAL